VKIIWRNSCVEAHCEHAVYRVQTRALEEASYVIALGSVSQNIIAVIRSSRVRMAKTRMSVVRTARLLVIIRIVTA
jgi:hypothetical protein